MPNELYQLLTAIKDNNYHRVNTLTDPSSDELIDVNLKGEYGEGLVEMEVPAVPLYLSLYLGNLEITKLLLKRGANPNLKSNNYDVEGDDFEEEEGESPLEILIRAPLTIENLSVRLEMIELLFRAGAVIEEDVVNHVLSTCRELLARKSIVLELYKTFAKKLCTLKVFDQFLSSVKNNDIELVKQYLKETVPMHDDATGILICSCKIDPYYDGGKYGTAILHAVSLEDSSMFKLLYENALLHGSKNHLKITDFHGNTPLHIAVMNKNFFMIDRLLDLKVDQTIKNNSGAIAEELSDDNAVHKLFRQYSAKGESALSWLCAKYIVSNNSGFFEEVISDKCLPFEVQSLVYLGRTGKTL